jgi:hypothetical protein
MCGAVVGGIVAESRRAASGRFFEKKLRKKLLFPGGVEGRSMAAQRPGESKVFCGAFFSKKRPLAAR